MPTQRESRIIWQSTAPTEATVDRWAAHRKRVMRARAERIGFADPDGLAEAIAQAAARHLRRPVFSISECRNPTGVWHQLHLSEGCAGEGLMPRVRPDGSEVAVEERSGPTMLEGDFDLHDPTGRDATNIRNMVRRGVRMAPEQIEIDALTLPSRRASTRKGEARPLVMPASGVLFVQEGLSESKKLVYGRPAAHTTLRAWGQKRTFGERVIAQLPRDWRGSDVPRDTELLIRDFPKRFIELTRNSFKQGREVGLFPPSRVNFKEVAALLLEEACVVPASWAHRQAEEAMAEFRSLIDPQLLQLAEQYQGLHASQARWLGGRGRSVIARQRRQALLAYPLLSQFYRTSRTGDPEMDHGRRIQAAIDRAEPLAPVISALYNLEMPAVAALRTVPPSGIKQIDACDQRALQPPALDLLRATPPDLLPGRRTIRPPSFQWRVFLEAAEFAAVSPEGALSTPCYSCPVRTGHVLRGEIPWFTLPEDTDLRSLRRWKLEITDAWKDIARQLIGPIHYAERRAAGDDRGASSILFEADWDAIHPVIRSLCGDRSLRALAELAKEWHAARPQLEDAILRYYPKEDRPDTWAPLCETFKAGDLQIVPLTTPEDLRTEGRRMNHCVGSYDHACRDGRSHILSIREAAGGSVSTVEIALDFGSDEQVRNTRVRQHYSHRNTPPPASAETALKAWVDAVKTRAHLLNPSAVEASRNSTKRWGVGEMPTVPVPDISDEGAEGLFMAYRRFLPGRARLMSRDDWIEAYGLREIYRDKVRRDVEVQAAHRLQWAGMR